MNTVGPYHNRQETYNYFSLPFCRGRSAISHYHETLGENILGVELEYSGVEINFKRKQHTFYHVSSLRILRVLYWSGDTKKTEICEVTVSPESYDTFSYAVKNHYWYQMFIDDLPIWGELSNDDRSTRSRMDLT